MNLAARWLAALIALPVLGLPFLLADLACRLVVRPFLSRRAYCWVAYLLTEHVLRVVFPLFFRLRLEVDGALPPELENKPFILVCNHTSPVDIALVTHVLGLRHPTFVCRPGLDRGVPFISYSLRHFNGLVLAPRDRDANLPRLRALGESVQQTGGGAVIFPEGRKTPSSYRKLRPFLRDGVGALLAGAPEALVIPIAITGAEHFFVQPGQPPRFNARIQVHILPAVSRDLGDEAVIDHCEQSIYQVVSVHSPESTDPALEPVRPLA